MRILDDTVAADASVLAELRADPHVAHVDSSAAQHAALRQLVPPPGPELLDERTRHVHYPWRRSVVTVVGPASYRRLRLDRNRNLITTAEQDRLGRLRIGIVGLSAGHVVAHTLAMQGLCGELRLADFDDLELSNLNRIPAGVFDLGLNKAVVAARRIAELDPYLTVRTVPTGVSADDVDTFLDGLDVVIEECDSLDVKALVRREARARGLPVLMATSDRGLVDVERFDLEPDRPIFHGLLGDDPDALVGLSTRDKVPHVLRLIEVRGLSARAAASLLEVGQAITTWPQLAGDVTLGAGAVAEAVRRIGLGERLSSGRIRLDVGVAFDRIESPVVDVGDAIGEPPPAEQPADLIGHVVAAAMRAPSGGNVQPWRISARPGAVRIDLAPEHTSTLDVAFRGSAVAVGAAAFNARIAAAARGVEARVAYETPTEGAPLKAVVRLAEDGFVAKPEHESTAYVAMIRRETNRRRGSGAPLTDDVRRRLVDTTRAAGGDLRLMTARADITAIADVFSAADRIRFLTPRLHREMVSEVRWPGDAESDTGIDVRSLELDPGGVLGLEVLRRPDVMAELSAWDGGAVLGEDGAAGLEACSAVAVVTAKGRGLADYARGGEALEAAWIAAGTAGLAVQPISPPFLYVTTDGELRGVAPGHADELATLQTRFHDAIGLDPDSPESLILVLRLSVAPQTTVRSRRRRTRFEATPLP